MSAKSSNVVKPDGTITLHGREYKTVALRVQEFREKHPIDEGWALSTKPVEITDNFVIFRAAIVDPQGREVAVGFAEEKRTNRGINATSALENCETSALGRALAAAGYGGSEYASADELVQALEKQNEGGQRQTQRAHPSWSNDHKGFIAALEERGLEYRPVAAYCEKRKWKRPAQWTSEERASFLSDLDGRCFTDLYDPKAPEGASDTPAAEASA